MTFEIAAVLGILAVTVVLLVLEIFRIDVVALLCMLALAWSGILEPFEAIAGFSSNAVIALIAVMIMGRGISKTGVMERYSRVLVRIIGRSRRRLIGLVSLSVGLTSAFMQNVGAAALFLPAVLDISKRERLPSSQLIMPLGFAAILGGTLTMVASGPLILLNDVLREAGLRPYGLFGVTPIGLSLLAAGILYFFVFGAQVLPGAKTTGGGTSEQEKLIDAWRLPHTIRRYRVPADSRLVGMTPEETGIWDAYSLNVLAVSIESGVEYAPWRKTAFEAGRTIALLGERENIERFAAEFGLGTMDSLGEFEVLDDPARAGFAEVVIPPRSRLAGRTIRQFAVRKRYHVEPIMFFSGGRTIRGDFSDRVIRAGDILVVHGLWESVGELRATGDFVVITPVETERRGAANPSVAMFCFLGGIGLAVAGFPISISLLTGAVAMVVAGALSIEDAYDAVEWKVVFLIAGLIPLGIAMQKTGAAAFLAEHVMRLVRGGHPIALIFAIALLSTIFSLFMSNVAATVVLAPLVIGMAEIGRLDPRPLVLLVAVCCANSFILPTHQVNAMLVTPGGYRNADYFKAGGGMTVLFLAVVTALFYFFYV